MNRYLLQVLGACAASLIAVTTLAAGSEFPAKPVRIVVPNPPGGTVEFVARSVGQVISPALGQNVIVDLRPGGNNIIGSEIVARAPADGYTLMLAGTHLALNPLVHKLPYDGFNAFNAVAGLAATATLFAVHPSVPVKTVHELIALARAKPGELNYASSTVGSAIHLAALRFQSLAKVSMNYVPYQGGIQAARSVVSGHVGVGVVPISDVAPFVTSGRLRPLAVTSAQRFALMKDVPTLAESGFPGFQTVQWLGAVAPAGTPKPVIGRLSAEMLRALENAELRSNFARLGIVTMPMDGPQFDALVRSEMRTFQAIIRDANLKLGE
jgi:tripartite-type tricarboxylate transporter receptor subunit TctC